MRRRGIGGLLVVLAGCAVTNSAEATRHFPRDPVAVWEAGREVARSEPRWTEVAACPLAGTLVYEAHSAVFGFTDDFVATVEPHPSCGAIVRMKSSSRVGKSDFGVNAARIARFLDLLAGRLAASPETTTPANGVAGVASGSR